jgi:outer membrane protein TolC
MFRHHTIRPLIYSLPALLAMTLGWVRTAGAQGPSPFFGSVPSGQATGTTLDLSLKQAFERALKYNLGAVESGQNTRAAHAVRLRALNALLPNLSARLSGTVQQLDLPSEGLGLLPLPIHLPATVGPYGIADARAYLSQEIFSWSDIKNWKSASESESAAQYAYQSDRDLVVYTTGNAYLLVNSDLATVDSTRAQVQTAQTLYQNSVDQNKEGVIASVDLLRAHVELQTQQQRLIAAENQLAIDKLTLARVIGLPNGQEFRITDTVPYAPLGEVSLEQALQQARSARPDYLSAQARVRAAELAAKAVAAENYPSLTTNTNYGDIGTPNFDSSHGTLGFALTLNIPIYQGSRVRADKLQADSALQQRKAELADLEGKIDDQVRTAFLNLQSSSQLVAVSRSNIDLANQTLAQAQDRFKAGVADNLEVVQAQESVATANQSNISSLYAFNLAKISLAQAMGIAEQSALQYLGVR